MIQASRFRTCFEYAVSDEAPQEPDAADMSVDDILNLRAGEPTTFFHARNVTDRADALHQAERQTFTPEHADKPELEDAFPSVSLVQETVVAADKPRDLFADAAAQAEAEAEIEPMRPIPLMRLRPMPRWPPSQPRQPLGPWKHPMTVTRTT